MKKSIAAALAAIIAASALSSCAPRPSPALDPKITLTSSDAADAAAWLDERLDEIPDRVVIGTDASAYGVDLSALEDDGYVIRALDGEIALLARTESGLDRAVRRFAKAVEKGEAVEDEVFHEGYRVEKLTIAGNDISEYAIVRATEDDPCVTTAASELSSYIEKTCGAQIAVCSEAEFAATGAKRRIVISSGDESLGAEGFRVLVSQDGTLTISGGIWRGSLFGVYDLLEDNIGWRFLAVKNSYYDALVPADRQEFLYEADHVDLTAAINRTEIPSIPIRGGCLGLTQKNTYHTQGSAKYGGFGFAIRACHGLQNYNDEIFSGEYEGVYPGFVEAGYVQPCFTNEDVLEAIDHFALEFVRTRLEAGQEIGKEIITVDVAHWDGGLWTFCKCKSCQKMYALEGCHTGAVMRMANRVCALLDENYPGVCVSILGYGPTAPIPKITRPADNLYIAFCFFDCDNYNSASCQNHCVSGVDCDQTKNAVTNYFNAQFFEEWLKIVDPKMIQIWYYPSEGYDSATRTCYASPIYKTILEDMKYIASFGVEHVYYCMERNNARNNGLICEGLFEYLGAKYMWDASISEEEGLGILREWFEIMCGKEAGDELFELSMFAERAGDLAGCWCSYESLDRVNYDYVALHADEVWEKAVRASTLADDEAGEAFAERFAAGFMYMVICGCYEDMYVNGTPGQRALITARCRETWERMCSVFGDDPDSFDPDVDPVGWQGLQAD